MRMRSALLALLFVPAVATVSAGADGSMAAAPTRALTVTGALEHVVVDTETGEDIRYAVRDANRTWWLDGLAEPAPAAGSLVEITGAPRDAYTLTVNTIRVSTAAAAVSPATPKSTRVLVLPVYWGTRPPTTPTRATMQRAVITDSKGWFEEVSHGRYTVSGTVTRWLKVRRPQDCFDGAFAIRDRALAAARRLGYDLGRFGRFVVYVPCNTSAAGLGYMPGKYVWLFNTLGKTVVMHEQGHNLGLPHATMRICQRHMMVVTWSANCLIHEYGDMTDTMGASLPGHYNAYYKSRLGWLQRSTTVTSSRTVALAPYETTGPGVKAIRLKAGGATYWLEYRRRTGADAGMLEWAEGVQIRLQVAGGQTQVLDAAPASYGWSDLADTHLPAGSSWTTPQRVRITVTGQSSSGATVAFAFGAPAPSRPGAPRPVEAHALVRAARVTWTRPADNGAVIRHYTITRSDGATRTVRMTGGTITSYRWDGLDPKRSYTFTVTATNEVGTSPAATSPPVRPLTDQPSLRITSPADGATVQSLVPVRIVATPSTETMELSHVELHVDGREVDRDGVAPYGPLEWDARFELDGRHVIEVIVWDLNGETATASRTVTLRNPEPTVTITSPSDGDTVTGQIEVGYDLVPAYWGWYTVDLFVDGRWWGEDSVQVGDPVILDTSLLAPGIHTLELVGDSPFGFIRSSLVTVTVADP